MKPLVATLLAVLVTAATAWTQSAAGPLGTLSAGPSRNEFRWDVRLPADSKLIDGFTLDIRAENTLLVGYHPVRLTAQSTSKFAADRTIEIQFHPIDANLGTISEGSIRSVIVCTLKMPQGVASVSKDVYLPHYTYDNLYNVRVTERGRELPGYGVNLGAPILPTTFSAIANRIGVLLPREVVGGNPTQSWQQTPDPSTLLQALPLRISSTANAMGRRGFNMTNRNLINSGLLGGSAGSSSANLVNDPHQQALWSAFPFVGCVLTEDQLWDNWLGYESLDILLMPLPLLQRLQKNDPLKAEAIRHFAAAGGTLWLYGAANEQTVHDVFQTVAPGEAARSESRLRLKRDLQSVEYSQLPEGVWIQEYVAGRLVCFADPYPFPGSRSMWSTLLQANPRGSVSTVRRGVDPTFGDVRFWNWVLPNVAKPPVYAFLTLLGLFALCVGPLAYRISRQLNRIYLMLLAAPVMAILTTLLMIGYGLLADGLGYQARVRQVTWVDSASGTGLRWARATYFSGIRPQDGLHFDAHTAVYPYPQSRIERLQLGEDEPVAGRIVLTAEQQNFAFGFLPSRQQRQFVTFAPQDNLGGIQAAPLDRATFVEKRPIHNRFRFALRSLILRDDQGDYWFAEHVGANQTVDAVRYANLLAAKDLRLVYSENVLEFPPGFQSHRGSRRGAGNPFDLVGNASFELPQRYRTMNDGLVEDKLRSMLQIDGQLPYGHFFAVADVTPDVVALEDSDLSDSVHFCLGAW